MLNFLNKKQSQAPKSNFEEALIEANIPYVYDADENKYSYIDLNAAEVFSVFETADGLEYEQKLISEKEAFDLFYNKMVSEDTISRYEDMPEYQVFFNCVEMAKAFSKLFASTETLLDLGPDGTIQLLQKKRGEVTILAAQREEKFYVDGVGLPSENENAIALKLIEYFYKKHKIYLTSPNCDFSKFKFKYAELMKIYIICQAIVKSIDRLERVEVKLIDGQVIFVLFSNDSALAYQLACKQNPHGLLEIYESDNSKLPNKDPDYNAVRNYLHFSENIKF